MVATVTTIITVVPTDNGMFAAYVDGKLICRSRQPFLDAARQLLKAGYPARYPIVMKHAGSDVVALRATIGAAAALTVKERAHGNAPRFESWEGWHSSPVRPPIAPNALPATSLPKTPLALLAVAAGGVA